MDFGKLKTSDWLLATGGVLFLVGGFLDWLSVKETFEGRTFEVSGASAFDFFFTGTVPWVLIVGSGALAVLLAIGTIKPGTTAWPLILLGATCGGTLLVLIRLISPALGENVAENMDVTPAIGLWLCSLAGVIATAGAVAKIKESGGLTAVLESVRNMRSGPSDHERGAQRDRGATDALGGSGAVPPPPPPPPPPEPQDRGPDWP